MSAVPVIYFNEGKADWAYAVHQALVKAEAGDPSLKDNPRWRRLREAAFADFEFSFVRTGVAR
jgi:hypothetical protein